MNFPLGCFAGISVKDGHRLLEKLSYPACHMTNSTQGKDAQIPTGAS